MSRVEIIPSPTTPLIRIHENSGAEKIGKFIELRPDELPELQRELMLARYDLQHDNFGDAFRESPDPSSSGRLEPFDSPSTGGAVSAAGTHS